MDVDKLDKTAKKIATMYDNGLAEVVSALYKMKDEVGEDKLVESLNDLNLGDMLNNKFTNIKKEYTKGHIEVLKEIKPPINND
ncbi:MAG: hypothetical protein Unbinned1524contig1003_31 [Prokaryotic dsDNA virus sp.]|nr:MAG: hypothetical protein Unbinned1524contig1003_31 [Prokaryotic dsDNA virus sp.]|tara:strand:- start:7359 stop:7607 length:249 start_codon:yes stop_codon:yes gene_type:complete